MSDTDTTTPTLRPPRAKVPLFSPSRVWTIASSTVTQLVRMKIFYFLLAFALLVVASKLISFAGGTPAKELWIIKMVGFGTMDVFAWLFAIVSTALLIPRDIEDRTLYTILSKPVRRIEYLVGKLGGVLFVIGVSLLAMYAICAAVLYSHEMNFVGSELEAMQADSRYSKEEIAQQLSLIQKEGLRAELGIAVLASFLKGAVVAVVTIFLSTFASSSLFTIIVSVLLFLIGHAHTMATTFWLKESDTNLFVQMLVKIVKILIPNYQLFSFSDGVVRGEAINYAVVSQMGILSLGYIVVFLLLSLLVFVDKEF